LQPWLSSAERKTYLLFISSLHWRDISVISLDVNYWV